MEVDTKQDQAYKLRELVLEKKRESPIALTKKATRVFTVTSGKGGVGKTNICLNLALAMAKQGKQVLVLDADLGLANLDVILGFSPQYNLTHVIKGEKKIQDIVTEWTDGIKIVASGSGVKELANLSEAEREWLIEGICELEKEAEIILIDTGAGLSPNVLSFVFSSDEVIVVATPEPTAFIDAYGMIKAVANEKKGFLVKLVANMVANSGEAAQVLEKLAAVSKKFLNFQVEKLGYVVQDHAVSKAVREQHPFFTAYPYCPASECIRHIAEKLCYDGRGGSIEAKQSSFFRKLAEVLTKDLWNK